jgi:7,8-dihydroneopterin aldolase/epimerase/oxygenase
MDMIFLSGLRFDAMIGIYPDERVSSRPVEIDLQIGVPGDRVFASGDVADTIDYAAVSERIRAELARVRYGLLEEMSQAIARILLDEFRAPWVKVSIVKLDILGDSVKVGVSIERRADRAAMRRSTDAVAPREIKRPAWPDYRMLSAGRFGIEDDAVQHALVSATTPSGRAPS